jgi:hypothetical protein
MSALNEMLSGAGGNLVDIGSQIIQLPQNVLGAMRGPQVEGQAQGPGIINRTTTAARKTLNMLGEVSDQVDQAFPHQAGQHRLAPFGLLRNIMGPVGDAGHAISDIFNPRAPLATQAVQPAAGLSSIPLQATAPIAIPAAPATPPFVPALPAPTPAPQVAATAALAEAARNGSVHDPATDTWSTPEPTPDPEAVTPAPPRGERPTYSTNVTPTHMTPNPLVNQNVATGSTYLNDANNRMGEDRYGVPKALPEIGVTPDIAAANKRTNDLNAENAKLFESLNDHAIDQQRILESQMTGAEYSARGVAGEFTDAVAGTSSDRSRRFEQAFGLNADTAKLAVGTNPEGAGHIGRAAQLLAPVLSSPAQEAKNSGRYAQQRNQLLNELWQKTFRPSGGPITTQVPSGQANPVLPSRSLPVIWDGNPATHDAFLAKQGLLPEYNLATGSRPVATPSTQGVSDQGLESLLEPAQAAPQGDSVEPDILQQVDAIAEQITLDPTRAMEMAEALAKVSPEAADYVATRAQEELSGEDTTGMLTVDTTDPLTGKSEEEMDLEQLEELEREYWIAPPDSEFESANPFSANPLTGEGESIKGVPADTRDFRGQGHHYLPVGAGESKGNMVTDTRDKPYAVSGQITADTLPSARYNDTVVPFNPRPSWQPPSPAEYIELLEDQGGYYPEGQTEPRQPLGPDSGPIGPAQGAITQEEYEAQLASDAASVDAQEEFVRLRNQQDAGPLDSNLPSLDPATPSMMIPGLDYGEDFQWMTGEEGGQLTAAAIAALANQALKGAINESDRRGLKVSGKGRITGSTMTKPSLKNPKGIPRSKTVARDLTTKTSGGPPNKPYTQTHTQTHKYRQSRQTVSSKDVSRLIKWAAKNPQIAGALQKALSLGSKVATGGIILEWLDRLNKHEANKGKSWELYNQQSAGEHYGQGT